MSHTIKFTLWNCTVQWFLGQLTLEQHRSGLQRSVYTWLCFCSGGREQTASIYTILYEGLEPLLILIFAGVLGLIPCGCTGTT